MKIPAKKSCVIQKKKKTTKSPRISKNMHIAKVIEKHPQLIEVFAQYGFHCVGCVGAQFDTIEAGAKIHGVHIEHFLHDLNECLKSNV